MELSFGIRRDAIQVEAVILFPVGGSTAWLAASQFHPLRSHSSGALTQSRRTYRRTGVGGERLPVFALYPHLAVEACSIAPLAEDFVVQPHHHGGGRVLG